MTGIGCIMAAGGPYGGGSPPPAFSVAFGVGGGGSGNVAGASGTVGTLYFLGVVSGDTPPTTKNWTIISNPSGKLGISISGNKADVTYSGMAVFESETITVQFDVADSGGNTFSDSASITVKRVS